MTNHKLLLRVFPLLLSLSASALNFGCATGADPAVMTVSQTQLPDYKTQAELKDSIGIGAVKGGEETNPLWTSEISSTDFKVALTQSLRGFDYFAEQDQARYSVDVTLLRVDQPIFGLDMTVKILARYVLKDLKTQEKILDEEIESTHTGKLSDSVVGFVRLKMANEGSANANISLFLKKLETAGLKKQSVSLM